ncbi:hypothetical protein Y032_0017g3201 [Ancylostoma ceylanicum]|uniref:Uncharacterized protein n=1 Tax=Ancylostoma ceylanicum TaxID=53326 RepID=A0A016V413_9BILA|nr:hypothetical protein Y032_0017g3201 [Ancylostoma ceylanicum]
MPDGGEGKFISRAPCSAAVGDGGTLRKRAQHMMTYGSNQHRYGRSPRQELLDDMREELLKAKKVNAQLALNNRLLNTKLQRLTREMKASNNNNNIVKDARFTGGSEEPRRYPSSASDRRPDSVDASNVTNASRYTPREPPVPTQQPYRPSNGMSVFSRPIAESSVRARTPVRNDTQMERGPQRSYTAMGGSGFDDSYPRNHYNSPQQSSSNRNAYRGDEPSYGQRPESNRYRTNASDEWYRPRSSASVRFQNTEYDDRCSGNRRDDNQRWPRDGNYHQNDTSGSSRREDNQRWPRNESFNHNYPGPEPTFRNEDRERPTFRQSDTAYDGRDSRYAHDDAQYRQRNDVFRGNGERANDGYRSQDMEHPSHSRNMNNSFVQPPTREERDHPDRYRDSSRQSFHDDRGQYSSASRQVERAEHSTPSTAQSRVKNSPNKHGGSRQRPRTSQVTVAPTPEGNSHAGTSANGETTLSDQIRVLQEKNKKKLRVAKAYAEQNRKLKERLKQMREEFYELRRNRIKSESGVTSPSPHLNELESWDTTQLVELITKLEATRLENAATHGTSEIGGSSDDFGSGSDIKEGFSGSNADTKMDSASHNKDGIGDKPSNDDQLPFDVLLYVIRELATAHCERQTIAMRLKKS